MHEDTMAPLCRHAAGARFEDIPQAARDATRTFLLDSLGVAVAGSRGPLCEGLLDAHRGPGPARILGTRERVPGAAAALLNAYQVHNSEFDCIYDPAVVHPMAVVLGAALATVDAADGPIDGRRLMAALCAGVDVACRIGAASRAPMRFFRPATAGAFGAAAAAGHLSGFDAEHMLAAMGITLAQLCGTMQAHSEGSPLLPVQAGFNARNAVVSCQLAARGLAGAREVLDGPFGYFALFEGAHDADTVTRDLGAEWAIARVSHKPFPSGRATHGVADACLQMRTAHCIDPAGIETVHAGVPPLTHRLVGRAPGPGMQPNYARLCGAWVAARALLAGEVGLADFTPAALGDDESLDLAGRILFQADDNPDPNALTPVTVSIRMRDGTIFEQRLDTVYGSPDRPMSREAHLQKFRSNCAAGVAPIAPERAEAAIEGVDALEDCDDVRTLLDLLEPEA